MRVKTLFASLLLFLILLLSTSISFARQTDIRFPTLDPTFISYGGTPSSDLDLAGIYKLKIDADGDTYLHDGIDDQIDFVVGGTSAVQFRSANAQIIDNVFWGFGSAVNGDAALGYSTVHANDALTIGLSADSRSLIISERLDFFSNLSHGLQPNPTVFLHSSDATDINDYISFTFNQTDGVIDVGQGDIKLDDDVNITGALTIGAYTRHVDIAAGTAVLGPTAPDPVTIGTYRCLEFNAAADEAFFNFEVPPDWDGISDMTLNLIAYFESGDVIADTETVVWDATYRSIADGEAYDNGTAVTISPIYTQSGAGTDKAQHKATVAIDYDNANQPLTADDEVGIQLDYDEGSSTYSGSVALCELEVTYTSVRPKVH